MMKLFRDDERGAMPGYVVGILTLAILLVGGVMLLKNVEGNKTVADKPITVETGEFKAEDEKTDEDKTTPAADNSNETETTATTATDRVATTGPTSEYAPEKLTATGPEDFVVAIIGLILVGVTIYTTRCYVKSRAVVKSALLKK